VPGEVADISMVPVLVAIQDQAGFGSLIGIAEAIGAQEEAQLERHVESGQASGRLGARDVVNAPTAVSDQGDDFLETNLAAVVAFQSAAWPQPACGDSEDECVADWPVLGVERTVEEHILSVGCRYPTVCVAKIRPWSRRHDRGRTS
jgi:hypothetical protein